MKLPVLAWLALVALVTLAACNSTDTPGSGVSKTESRTVAPFDAVEAAEGIAVVVKVGASGPLQVSGDDNLVPLVATEVTGGRLTVKRKGNKNLRPKLPLRVEVPVANPKTLAATSGGTLEASGIAADALTLEASSGGTLKVSGTAKSESVEASAGGTVSAGDLATGTATVQASVGGSADVRVATSVSGTASGGGHVHVRGKPTGRSIVQSSGGSVDYE